MDRSEILKNILGHLKTEVPELQKVKAYEGELRAGDEKFLDETKGVFPCVLAVWDNRKSSGEKGTLAGQKNEIVFFLAMKDFAASDREVPTIYPLLDKMKSKLDRYRPELPGVGELQYKGDRHVAHNSFYVLYEQRFTVAEGLPVSQAASEDFLVTAVQQALRIGLDITEKDIFLAPDPEYFPPDAGDICIGIKDGNTDREEDISECLDLTEEIHLCLHVRLPRGETDLSFLITEILSLEKKIHKILDQNTFELPGYTDAFCDGGKASKTADRHSARQTKAIIYKYTKEQKRESSE